MTPAQWLMYLEPAGDKEPKVTKAGSLEEAERIVAQNRTRKRIGS